MTAPRFCALVPTYDNPLTIGSVVDRIREHLPDVVVVDDGSAEPGRRAVEALGAAGRAHVHRLEHNRGKGGAVKEGFRVARELGFTHALQIDADGQHDVAEIPRFLAAAAARPDALVLGVPVFDATAPASRQRGRLISRFWTDLETGGRVIEDPLCGFRVYPLDAALHAGAHADRMDFDPEIAVRMVWNGCPVVNLRTLVRYLSPEEGGVSHFRMFRDNVLISLCHARLFTGAILRFLTLRPLRRRA
jgi:glycosyltransferase involved in cell wall biosynthesis